ncbi:MAG: hypothetical protein ACOWWR_01870 [Eubacteriales bacterium]
MKKLFLGIDTSNYTSSFALIDEVGTVLEDVRIMLSVKNGQKGLRQSDAVFQHIQNLEKISTALKKYDKNNLQAIAASITPRSVEDSYMPVFTVSKNIGLLLASVLNVPYYKTTHQLGHIRNAMAFSNVDVQKPFIAIHFSGGTSEVLSVHVENRVIIEKIIGKTLDITAGQLIDRIGVLTGLAFPSGRHMEQFAYRGEQDPIPTTYYFKEGNVSYSGVETALKKIFQEGNYPVPVIYDNLFHNIAVSLEKLIHYHCQMQEIYQVLLFGGVLANEIVKKYLMQKFSGSSIQLFFCNKVYSSDNAVGVSYIAKDYYGENE